MSKLVAVLIFIWGMAAAAFAADIKYDIKNDEIDFTISFTKGYSNLDTLKSGKNVIISFETAEEINFKRQDFFDMPITSAYLISDSFRKKFVVSFEGELVEPAVRAGDKFIAVKFSFPYGTLTVPRPLNGGEGIVDDPALIPAGQQTKPPAAPGAGSYFRMMFGLIIVLLIILVLYKVLKNYAGRQVFTDIPGSGRLLGKVDLEIRKSLYFYEIGDVIYIIGGSDHSLTLIDKVSDDSEISKIKTGLTKKREFAGYMSFFKRKNELDAEISVSNAVVEEKLKALRKK